MVSKYLSMVNKCIYMINEAYLSGSPGITEQDSSSVNSIFFVELLMLRLYFPAKINRMKSQYNIYKIPM